MVMAQTKHILFNQGQLIWDVTDVWKEDPEQKRKTWSKKKKKEKEIWQTLGDGQKYWLLM